jgi:hypothetical protein
MLFANMYGVRNAVDSRNSLGRLSLWCARRELYVHVPICVSGEVFCVAQKTTVSCSQRFEEEHLKQAKLSRIELRLTRMPHGAPQLHEESFHPLPCGVGVLGIRELVELELDQQC